jgi:hypothetical protein
MPKAHASSAVGAFWVVTVVVTQLCASYLELLRTEIAEVSRRPACWPDASHKVAAFILHDAVTTTWT